MNFASNLQKLRKKENMSQEVLAEQLDVTRQSVSKWESGVTYPEMDKLISICKIFNVDMDTLVNGDVSKNTNKDNTINTKDILIKFDTLMKKIVCLFENMNFKEMIGFFVTILFLIIIIALCRIPVEIIEGFIGSSILYNISYVGPTLNTIFRLILDILYGIGAIIIFIYVIKIKYLDRISIKDEINKEIIIKEKDVKIPETKEVIIKDDNTNSLTNTLAHIIIYIIKFFIICFLIVPLISIVICATMLGFLVLFVFKGFPLMGILLGVVAALIISTICFEVPLNFVINHKNNYKRIMITLLITLIIIIIGSVVFAFQIFPITYINDLPEGIKTKEVTEIFPMANNFRTMEYYNASDVEFVVDDTLTDDVLVTLTYYDYLIENNFKLELHDNNLLIYEDEPKEISFGKALNVIGKDLKEDKFYNYNKLDEYKVTIKTSSENINIIKNNS